SHADHFPAAADDAEQCPDVIAVPGDPLSGDWSSNGRDMAEFAPLGGDIQDVEFCRIMSCHEQPAVGGECSARIAVRQETLEDPFGERPLTSRVPFVVIA